jgi:hypothetical protein
VLAVLAGCGGSADVPDERPAPDRRVVFGELRSPDARSPFVAAGGAAWRCPTAGEIVLTMSDDGEATLTIDGMVLASVARTRAVVNRACERAGERSPRAPAEPRGGRLGATVVRCRAPATVLVDFHAGDLTVRAHGRGRLLVRAAVRPDRIGAAGYWGEGCRPA